MGGWISLPQLLLPKIRVLKKDEPEHLLIFCQRPWPATHEKALIQRRAKVLLYSSLPDEIVRKAFLTPCHDITAAVEMELTRFGPDARVAVLPQGPLTIPYLA